MKTILFLVTEDFAFLSHRLPMARAVQQAGFQVGVACRVEKDADTIRAMGFDVYPLQWNRRSTNIIAAIMDVWAIVHIYRTVRPVLVHHVALKPSLFGALAAWLAGVPVVVNALTGMGYFFTSQHVFARVLRVPIALAMRLLFNRRNSRLLLQNNDDRAMLIAQHIIAADKTCLIRGSGIELDVYAPLPEPAGDTIYFGFVARMLDDKGVRPMVQAYQLCIARGLNIGLVMAGTPDPANPATIPQTELDEYAKIPGIEFWGQVDDVRRVWEKCHVAVLPSRREGLPKALLEAAACARAIIATDVPGCREICVDGENGTLVPMDDAVRLADAMQQLAEQPARRQHYAVASRRMVESDLSASAVGGQLLALYHTLLTSTGQA